MTRPTFFWMSRPVPFSDGESIAAALTAAGIVSLGRDPVGQSARYFCGIGACQACTVRVAGVPREACLTRAEAGARVEPLHSAPFQTAPLHPTQGEPGDAA